jgi:hypothetical protein
MSAGYSDFARQIPGINTMEKHPHIARANTMGLSNKK